MIKIVTDSTCDLPQTWVDRYKITIIPINIQFGLETFHEGVNLTEAAFYQRIAAGKKLPTTSQPSVGQFCQLYEALAADGSEILSIHVTSKLSGTWQSAHLSARQVADRIKVSVVDSLTGSSGLGLMVREAAQLIEAGWTIEQIIPRLESRPAHIFEIFMLEDLRHARMSGRVGRLREFLVSLLDIKPIVGVDTGTLIPLDRTRSRKKGIERMLTLAETTLGERPVHVGVVHALVPEQADDLLRQIQQRLNCQDSFITELSLSLAVHLGPEALGFVAYPAN